LQWGESLRVGEVNVTAQQVKHWGARTFYDKDRGFNAYLLESSKHRVLYGGDTAYHEGFRAVGPVDLAILGIGPPQLRADARADRTNARRSRAAGRSHRRDPNRRDLGAGMSRSLIRSFGFAFAGIGYFFRTQRNAQIELAIGVAACGLALWLRISRMEWAILLLTIASVLILEGLNTALEAAVDLASPDLHPLAKTAKDDSAGMVLIAAVASVGVGLLILGPPLLTRLGL
jgi:diacylglycerol kinase